MPIRVLRVMLLAVLLHTVSRVHRATTTKKGKKIGSNLEYPLSSWNPNLCTPTPITDANVFLSICMRVKPVDIDISLSVYRCLAAGIRQRTTVCGRCSELRTRPKPSSP